MNIDKKTYKETLIRMSPLDLLEEENSVKNNFFTYRDEIKERIKLIHEIKKIK
jgi:hypothetical protein